MSRVLTLLAIILTAVVSYGLYHLSYEVQRLEEELIDQNRALLRDREAIQVLNAEWTYLTRPEALQVRAQRNLQLQPLLPKQIVGIDQIPMRKDAPAVAANAKRDERASAEVSAIAPGSASFAPLPPRTETAHVARVGGVE